MKITKRIKSGKYKGYTIRKSKYGWYDLYSQSGISQFAERKTLQEINEIIKTKKL